jgi:hypothetical protein
MAAYEGYANDRTKIEAEIRRFEDLERLIEEREHDAVMLAFGRKSADKCSPEELLQQYRIPAGFIEAISRVGELAKHVFQSEFAVKSIDCIRLVSDVAEKSGFSEDARKSGRPETAWFFSIRTIDDLKSMWSGVRYYADRQ